MHQIKHNFCARFSANVILIALSIYHAPAKWAAHVAEHKSHQLAVTAYKMVQLFIYIFWVIEIISFGVAVGHTIYSFFGHPKALPFTEYVYKLVMNGSAPMSPHFSGCFSELNIFFWSLALCVFAIVILCFIGSNLCSVISKGCRRYKVNVKDTLEQKKFKERNNQ